MTIKIDVVGDETVKAAIQATGAKLTRAIQGAVAEAALTMESKAKKNASGRPGPNVKTGRLRSSIGSEIDGDGLGATVAARAEYADSVENTHGYRFMAPAAEDVQSEFTDMVTKHARKVTGG